MSVLIRAISDRDIQLVRQLLESGLDPNTLDHDGWPAISLAIDVEADAFAQNGDSERLHPSAALVSLLLEFGADPNLCSREGRSPLDYALGGIIDGVPIMYHPSAVNLLLEAGGRAIKVPYNFS